MIEFDYMYRRRYFFRTDRHWMYFTRCIDERHRHHRLKCDWNTHMGAAATAQCDESGSWIRKHYRSQLWMGGGRGRWFRCRATFSDTCKLRCCSTTQQNPPLVFRMNGAWPEHVEWTAWCRTWGKTWWWWNVGNRRKYGVWREVLFRAAKSPRKFPATTQRR